MPVCPRAPLACCVLVSLSPMKLNENMHRTKYALGSDDPEIANLFASPAGTPRRWA